MTGSLEDYVGALRALEEGLVEGSPDRIGISFRGRMLAPTSGFLPDALVAYLRCDTLTSVSMSLALAVQMRVVDELTGLQWRIESVTPEKVELLEDARATLDEIYGTVAAAVGRGGVPYEDRDALAEALTGLASLQRMLAKVIWNGRAGIELDGLEPEPPPDATDAVPLDERALVASLMEAAAEPPGRARLGFRRRGNKRRWPWPWKGKG